METVRSSPFRIMPHMNYSIALRCIGQDLDRRGLKCFDIRVHGAIFTVEGGYQDPPSSTPVSIEYTRRDLDEMDQQGESRRGQPSQRQEFINQVQVFRTIGAFLDKNEACLLRLTNNHDKTKDTLFIVEYLTRDGERVVDDRAGAAIYDMCVQMYKQRGKWTGTEGRRSRWRR
jgi:hypothetical protein